MKELNVTQGTPEWLAARIGRLTASEAPAMMGISKYMTRDELMRRKATGDTPEFDAPTLARFADGHRTEALARAIIEQRIGEDLFPITATDDAGRLLSSYDGLTMDGKIGFEHKLWNKDLAAKVLAKELPPEYYWQLEQQILIGGLEYVIFTVSDGTEGNMVSMEYKAVPGRAEQLLAGWKQFEEDLKNYQHVEVKPAPAAKAIEQLPALVVQVTGMVQSSNLVVYRERALAFIQGINTNLQTDQDFADAERTVKFCSDAEKELVAVKRNALAQTASIDELFRTVDLLSEEMRAKRLELDRLVKARKDALRDEIRRGGVDALDAHIVSLEGRIGCDMPYIEVDFAGVMKGKKTIASLNDAVNTELARAKIEANAVADRIDMNKKSLTADGADWQFLFPDFVAVAAKAKDDFAALLSMRIGRHKEAEAKKEADLRAKLEAEAKEKADAEAKAAADAKAKAEADAVAQAAAKPATTAQAQPAPAPKVNMAAEAFRNNPPPPASGMPKYENGAAPAPAGLGISTMPARTQTIDRPPDDQIIHAIVKAFGAADELQVVGWLMDMDLDGAASARIQKATAAA